ncbi:histidine kinase [Piscinibacter sp. XHJ-5]|uniref:histidine kinase n=1 Tax=Piscinibacter sp. XHJ-5 TaxID=3037797 RepID=UPI002452814C|nr:histidine kinase [Piscinibacter sp. XHJ-5]
MSLRLKINLLVGAMTVLFVAALLLQQFGNMRKSVNEEVVAANRVAAQLLNRTVWGYAAQGPEAMLAFLRGVGRVRSNDITLLDHEGRELYRSPPSEYKAGRNAPAWFESLVAPALSTQSIEFPVGKLVVHANASRAALDAWDDFVVQMGTAAVMLVLVNLLVFWLVGQAVKPFGRIVAALNALEAGRFDVVLPRLPGREAFAIGAAFNRMVGMLQENLANARRAALAERQLSDNRELARWVDQKVEEERRMIARELHDELGQSVTAMRSMALSIAQRTQSLDPEAERAAQLIAGEASRLYDAMHGLIPRLTPLVLEHFGLEEALGDLVERMRRSHPGVRIDLKVDLHGAAPSPNVVLTLYRAAQEGITNALRHGQAQVLSVRANGSDEAVTLELTDDGGGLAPDWSQRSGHYGLRWLAERVESVGGQFRIEPRAPRGVRLQVQVPLPSPSEIA